MSNKKQAYTLLELLVSILILSILGTLAFISLQDYQRQARDSARVTDIANIRTALELQVIETGKHPLPGNSYEVQNGSNPVWTQGEFTQEVANRLKNLSHAPVDPEYQTPYIYSVDHTKQNYELGGILSNSYEYSHKHQPLNQQAHAANNYQTYVSGNYNGYALEDESGNIVVVPSIIMSYTGTGVDISTLTNSPSELFTMNGVPNPPGSFKNQIETDPSQAFKYQATIFSNYDVDSFIKNIQGSYSGALFTKRTSYSTINTAVENGTDSEAEDLEVAQMYLASQSLIEQITGEKIVLDICVAGNQVLNTGESTLLYTQNEYPFEYTPVETTDYMKVICVNGNLGMNETEEATYTHNSYFNTAPAQCSFNTQNYNHNDPITSYSENEIEWDATYNCTDRDQTSTCYNGNWTPALGAYTHPVCAKGTPENCTANPNYIYNTHTYSFPLINHADSDSNTIQVNENNGTYEYTLTVTCSDNTYTNPSEIKTETPVSCDTGYTMDGNNCYQNCEAGTTNNYTYTAFNHNQTQNVNKTITIANGTRDYTATATCTNNIVSISNENADGPGICDTNYTWNNTIESCEADTQLYTCTSKPANTVWNSVSNYTQTWNGTQWLPADSTTSYNTTASTTTCNYTCDTGYHTEDNNSCISNTGNCSISNGTSSQTWNGTSWDACIVDTCDTDYYTTNNTSCTAVGVGYYSNATDTTRTACSNKPSNAHYTSDGNGTNNCSWSCDTNYTWNGSICEANTQACSVSGGTGSQVWNGSSWDACIVDACTVDYYKTSPSVCSAVGIGYYSANNSITRTVCTNHPDTTSRNYSYTSDGNGTNSCTATYTELCGVDTYETSNGTCTAVGNGYYSTTNNNSRTACTNHPDTASRNYSYTSDGNGGNNCNASYTQLCGVDTYETSNGTCSAVGTGYYSPSNNNTRTACTNKPLNSTYTSDGNGGNSCSWTCDTGYIQDGSTCTLSYASLDPTTASPKNSVTLNGLRAINNNDEYYQEQAVFSDTTIPKGTKKYFEFKGVVDGPNYAYRWNIGISKSLLEERNHDDSSTVRYHAQTGQILKQNTVLSSPGGYVINDVIGVAVDTINWNVTFYKNGSLVGSASIEEGNYYVVTGIWASSEVEVYFNPSQWTYSAPSGYTALSKKGGTDFAFLTSAPNINVGVDNLSLTFSQYATNYIARSNVGMSSGKYAFKLTSDQASTALSWQIGVMDSSNSIQSNIRTYGIGYNGDDNFHRIYKLGSYINAAQETNYTVEALLDIDNGKIEFWSYGTKLGEETLHTLPSGEERFFVVTSGDWAHSGHTVDIDFGQNGYSAPSGYSLLTY